MCVCWPVYRAIGNITVFPLGLNSNRVVNITIIEYYYGMYTGHEEGMICFCRLTFCNVHLDSHYVCTIYMCCVH